MMDTKVERHRGVKVTILPDGMIAMQMENENNVYMLTPVGGLVWEFCDGTNTVDEVVARIGLVDGVAVNAELKNQVLELIADLQKHGLLVSAGSVAS